MKQNVKESENETVAIFIETLVLFGVLFGGTWSDRLRFETWALISVACRRCFSCKHQGVPHLQLKDFESTNLPTHQHRSSCVIFICVRLFFNTYCHVDSAHFGFAKIWALAGGREAREARAMA